MSLASWWQSCRKTGSLINVGVALRDSIVQATGFAQGDDLSPLLSSVLVKDLPRRVTERHPFVDVILYADDLAMFSTSRFHMQQALATLASYVKEIGLTINKAKSEAMKIKRGGKVSTKDDWRLGGKSLRFSKSFRIS